MQYFHHDNVRLRYQDVGRGAPVLLLHGLGSCTEDWLYQIAALSTNNRVIALDLRGHGQSAAVRQAYLMRQLAEDAQALMEHLQLPAYHVVGFSMGGMVAFELALHAKESVQSLVIINSGPQALANSAKKRWQLMLRQLIISVLGMRSLGRVIGRKLFPQPHQQALRERFESGMAKMDKTSYQLALRAISQFSVQSSLPRITQPTLVISSDQDYTPISHKAEYVRLMPNARLVVIENSRHATPIDQPDALNKVLTEFIGSQCRAGMQTQNPDSPTLQQQIGEHHA
ncbi:alpha/beta hydrolase [Bowmanella sp. Y26]|uniref:alpha/beta fold hydrolase n=1 Tax=Bowmanella yangjiangensis TaxID=2811230 RepID=UPI001BDC6E51|nr:alpha/beta hydrolase [Bowmanella yangjiangensis]MBT1065354.1 alpha/beta hydrolase [Bowmanella yangjiangensis]